MRKEGKKRVLEFRGVRIVLYQHFCIIFSDQSWSTSVTNLTMHAALISLAWWGREGVLSTILSYIWNWWRYRAVLHAMVLMLHYHCHSTARLYHSFSQDWTEPITKRSPGAAEHREEPRPACALTSLSAQYTWPAPWPSSSTTPPPPPATAWWPGGGRWRTGEVLQLQYSDWVLMFVCCWWPDQSRTGWPAESGQPSEPPPQWCDWLWYCTHHHQHGSTAARSVTPHHTTPHHTTPS